MKKPTFREQYEKACYKAFESACMELKRGTHIASGILLDTLCDDETPHAVRVSAARAVLEYGMKYTECYDILNRIDRIEKAVNSEN